MVDRGDGAADRGVPATYAYSIGTTTVTCSATVTAGGSATASFTVYVEGAPAQNTDLYKQVAGVDTGSPIGTGTSLADKVTAVQTDLASNDTADACGALGGFINQVNAQAGKIGTSTSSLITQAQNIQTTLGC